jgi:hypothetical protein
METQNRIGFNYFGFSLSEIQSMMLGLLERIERLEHIKKPTQLQFDDLQESRQVYQKLAHIEAQLWKED